LNPVEVVEGTSVFTSRQWLFVLTRVYLGISFFFSDHGMLGNRFPKLWIWWGNWQSSQNPFALPAWGLVANERTQGSRIADFTWRRTFARCYFRRAKDRLV